MTSDYSLSDIAAVSGNNDGFGGGNGAWWIIILFLFALTGNWNNGGGFGGGNDASSVKDQYVLSSDFATIQRQLSDGFNSIDNALDAQNNGICNLGYTQLQLANGIDKSILQGVNSLSAQIADCCCKTQQNIKDTQYTVATTGANIQNQIQSCCCDVERQIERGFADTNYNMATQSCQTLSAIDKVGDRIIDYLSAQDAQRLRDENQTLKLAASQQAQNSYLINTLRPMPIPAFPSCNPWSYQNSGCGCTNI